MLQRAAPSSRLRRQEFQLLLTPVRCCAAGWALHCMLGTARRRLGNGRTAHTLACHCCLHRCRSCSAHPLLRRLCMCGSREAWRCGSAACASCRVGGDRIVFSYSIIAGEPFWCLAVGQCAASCASYWVAEGAVCCLLLRCSVKCLFVCVAAFDRGSQIDTPAATVW